MKTNFLISGIFLGAVTFISAATNDLTSAIQRGLFEEEANQNLGAAIQAYQSVANQFDKDRKLAATAIFRLGECYRKQGNTNDAATQYQRILREFSDQPTLVTLSRQNLAGMSSLPPAAASASVLPDDTLQKLNRQLAKVETETFTVENQLEAFEGLPKDKLRSAVQKNYPYPELDSLLRKRAEAEKQVATLLLSFTPQDPQVMSAKAQVEKIDKQIDEQVTDFVARLVSRRDALKTIAKNIRAQAVSASPLPTGVLPTTAPALSDAARQEQKRLVEEEMSLVQKQMEALQKEVDVNGAPKPGDPLPLQRQMLELKRQVAALDAGLPISFAASGPTAPATSSEADEVKSIQALIKDSPDLINAPDRKGETLLQFAAAKGKLAVVKLLLDSGAAVDGLQQPGLTPLHCAAANGHKAVVDLLLSKGAKADAQTEGGATPLHLAALKGYETVGRALLAAGAPVNAQNHSAANRDTENVQYHVDAGQTPLHLAANAGYTGMVELLLAKGANPDAEDGSGRTPLSYAVQNHSEPVVKLLLAAHANPNAGRGNLPLAVAAGSGDLAALKLLLANGADPNTNTAIGWPLAEAVDQKHADAAAELLRFKANPNPPDVPRDPLLFAALPDAPTLKALLDAGADSNVRNHRGNPLLLQAVQDRNQPAVELLLAHKADGNAALLPDAWTTLHSAAGMGTKAIAELLLKAGASVKARNKDGETPLHVAVRQGQRDMVELLLANKADPNARDNAGLTPLDLAKHPARSNIPPPGMPIPMLTQPFRVPSPGVPGGYSQPINITVETTATQQESKPESMVDLLRRRGAVDDLPQLNRITVRRPSANISSTVFAKGTNDWNQFTLVELLGVEYNFLSFPGYHNYPTRLRFPDLVHLHIRRPTPGLKGWQEQVVDFSPLFLSGDCAKDLRLEWGDVVEIPETDHPLSAQWSGFPEEQQANVKRCLSRQVEIIIKGQSTKITLALGINVTSFCIKRVLGGSNLLLASSDLSHIKVTRRVVAGREYHWVVDCSEGRPEPDFWLRDGDKIEVPERGQASAAAEAPGPQPSPK